MDAKDAVAAAKAYIGNIYADEGVTNLGLEEVEFDEPRAQWHITLGFSRPWNSQRTAAQRMMDVAQGYTPQKRSFKVLTLDENGNVISMKNRIPEEAA